MVTKQLNNRQLGRVLAKEIKKGMTLKEVRCVLEPIPFLGQGGLTWWDEHYSELGLTIHYRFDSEDYRVTHCTIH